MSLKFITGTVEREVLKSGEAVFHVPQSDVNSFMESKGITKDLLKKVEDARTALITEGTKFLGEQLIKAPVVDDAGEHLPQKMIFGSGNGKITLKADPVCHYTKPHPKDTPPEKIEHITKYGVISVSIQQSIPSECQAICDQVAADVEKSLGKLLKGKKAA